MKKTIYLLLWMICLEFSATAQKTVSFDVPFELVNGMILVEASVNGDSGTFVLDTGFPTVVVNTQNAGPLRLAENQPATHERKKLAVTVSHFRWADIERKNMSAVAMDISHLESTSEKKILGVIGFEVLRQYELLFDFDHKRIMMLPSKDNWLHRAYEPVHRLRFKMHGQLPVVKAEIAGEKVRLGLDSGGTNLLSDEMFGAFSPEELGKIEREKMVGFGFSTKRLKAARLPTLSIGGTPFGETRFVFDDLAYLKQHRIDGLLGLPFLAQYRFSINYKEKRVYFWPNNASIWGHRI